MSTITQIFKEKYCEIHYDHSDQILYAKWVGFLKLDDAIKGCSAMTAFVKKNNVQAHLSDHRELKVLGRDVQDYLTQQWFPEVEKVGLRKVAALVSEDVFAKATVDKVNNRAKVGQLVIQTYNSKHDCQSWLSGEKIEA